MKFITTWARIAAENVTLKVASALLAAIAVFQLVALIQLSNRAPVIVERSCYSRSIPSGDEEHSSQEIEAFLSEALPMRLSSEALLKSSYFSEAELTLRTQEIDSLKAKQITQKYVFSSAAISENEITAKGDRIVSLGTTKSVLPLKARISLKAVSRSDANPYGLVMTSISQVQEEKNAAN